MAFSSSMYLAFIVLPSAFSVEAPHPKMTLAVAGSAVKAFSELDDASHPKMTLAVAGSAVKTFSDMEMAQTFARSDEVHQRSMDAISKNLTLPKAMDVIQHSSLTDSKSTMSKVTGLMSGSQNLRAAKDTGFGGLDGARRLLNSMIFEAMVKYDAEIARCTSYYAKQCALMEVARGQISAANFRAATSRALILDAQANINQCEKDIPETKQQLKNHNLQCKIQLHKMNEALKVLMGDIAVMTMILKMSDCDAKGFVQTQKLSLLRCRDECTNKDTVTFNHNQLQNEVDLLKSPNARDLVAETFADLFDAADDSDDSLEFVQVNGSDFQALVNKTKPSKTKFNNPPVPKTKVPNNPCNDPNSGAPSMADKRAAKCTLKASPQCYKLQGRFLQIQAGIEDARDKLMEEIAKEENACHETKNTLQASIEADSSLLSSSQTKLAQATEKESTSGENGRQVSAQNDMYNADLLKQMKTCSTNYINFETELCALRKIRGDLFKKMFYSWSNLQPSKWFFQDCEVTPWSPEACTKVCGKGTQKLTRAVMTHPSRGTKCLPLSAKRDCNLSPCPIDCKLEPWAGWSKCSSKCGGGLMQRTRDVIRAAQHDGKQCSATVSTKQCNVAACEKDCVLHEWTKWTSCSKNCDGGSRKRQRMIKEPAEGAGTCAGSWSPARLEYRECAQHRCKSIPTEVMKCNQSLDIVLLMDGTPKSGKAGWGAEQKAANLFVDAFTGEGVEAKPNFAVIHYTGPRTWSGVSKCTSKSTKKVDMEKDCRVKIAQHFTTDMKDVKSTISGLEFAPGSKLLSLGLMTVQSEMALGRADRRSIVIVFMDGEPLSYRKTMLASHAIRKKARLMYVVVTKFAPLKDIKTWSSRRWQENVVTVSTADQLALPETGTHIIANICPRKFQALKFKRLD